MKHTLHFFPLSFFPWGLLIPNLLALNALTECSQMNYYLLGSLHLFLDAARSTKISSLSVKMAASMALSISPFIPNMAAGTTKYVQPDQNSSSVFQMDDPSTVPIEYIPQPGMRWTWSEHFLLPCHISSGMNVCPILKLMLYFQNQDAQANENSEPQLLGTLTLPITPAVLNAGHMLEGWFPLISPLSCLKSVEVHLSLQFIPPSPIVEQIHLSTVSPGLNDTAITDSTTKKINCDKILEKQLQIRVCRARGMKSQVDSNHPIMVYILFYSLIFLGLIYILSFLLNYGHALICYSPMFI